MHNVRIINQIKEILESQGIRSSLNKKQDRLLFYGETVTEFLNLVPIRNPKHLNKLKASRG